MGFYVADIEDATQKMKQDVLHMYWKIRSIKQQCFNYSSRKWKIQFPNFIVCIFLCWVDCNAEVFMPKLEV